MSQFTPENTTERIKTLQAEVECLRKVLAEKDKYFQNQLTTLTKAIELLNQTTDYLYDRDLNLDLQQDIDDFLKEVVYE